MEFVIRGDIIKVGIKKRKKDFFGALKGINPFKKSDRMKDRSLTKILILNNSKSQR